VSKNSQEICEEWGEWNLKERNRRNLLCIMGVLLRRYSVTTPIELTSLSPAVVLVTCFLFWSFFLFHCLSQTKPLEHHHHHCQMEMSFPHFISDISFASFCSRYNFDQTASFQFLVALSILHPCCLSNPSLFFSLNVLTYDKTSMQITLLRLCERNSRLV
jgi:hypothetical protein